MNSKYENSNDVVHHLEYNAERSHLIIPIWTPFAKTN
jgi:hypothetical protein